MLAALLGEIHMTLPPHLGLAQWWPDFTGVVHRMARSLQIDPEGKLCTTARPYMDQVNQFHPRLAHLSVRRRVRGWHWEWGGADTRGSEALRKQQPLTWRVADSLRWDTPERGALNLLWPDLARKVGELDHQAHERCPRSWTASSLRETSRPCWDGWGPLHIWGSASKVWGSQQLWGQVAQNLVLNNDA